MKPMRIEPQAGRQFPAEREQDITASVCGALFGEHEYTTEWAMWQQHANGMLERRPGEIAQAGQVLEPAIARLLELRHGLTLEKETGYWRDPQERLGASLDFHCYRWGDTGQEWREGIPLDVKNVSEHAWSRRWHRGERIPNQYVMQLQLQCGLTFAPMGLLGLLIGGHETKVIPVPFSQPLLDELVARARAFWASVADAREPLADPREDTQDLLRVYRRADPTKTADLNQDNEAQELCARYLVLDEAHKEAAKVARETDGERTIVKAALFQKLKSAGIGRAGKYLLESTTRSRRGYTVEPGQSRSLTITEN